MSAIPPRPHYLPVNVNGIPAELKRLASWVVWRAVWNGDRWEKKPYDPVSGAPAKVNQPDTWACFDLTFAAYQRGRFDGCGLVLTARDPYTVPDLDKSRNPESAEIADWAQVTIDRLDSYTEVSPSATGLHVIVKAELPLGARKRTGTNEAHSIEVYDRSRFIALTGHIVGNRTTINDRQEALTTWHGEALPPTKRKAPSMPTRPPVASKGRRTDDTLIAFLRRTKPRFSALYDHGDTGGNHSGAMQSLCDFLANAGALEPQIDRIARQSALLKHDPDHLAKWDRIHWPETNETHGEHTIREAVESSYAHGAPPPEPSIVQDETTTADANACSGIAAENALLREAVAAKDAALVAMTAERDQLHADLVAVLSTVTSPELGGKAVTMLKTATAILEGRARGEADEDGYVPASPGRVSEDHGDPEADIAPIMARSTAWRHQNDLVAMGLLKRRMRKVERPIPVKRRGPDKKWQFVRDDQGRIVTKPGEVEISCFSLDGRFLSDMLAPATSYHRSEEKPKHGGDRRSKAFRLNQTACPDCGAVEHTVVCRACGCNITATLASQDAADTFQDEITNATTTTDQNETPSYGDPQGGVPNTLFQDETSNDLDPTSMPPEPPGLWGAAEPEEPPEFTHHPPVGSHQHWNARLFEAERPPARSSPSFHWAGD